MSDASLVTIAYRKARQYLPRHFQLFCVGASKTGTTSMAEMFRPVYRVSHEPDIHEFNRQIVEYMKGNVPESTIQKQLRQRDWAHHLEVESGHPLVYIADVITNTFPEAKFIVTIREPWSWLRSRLNYSYKHQPPSWTKFRTYFYGRHHDGYDAEEAVLKQNGLYSLDAYLRKYVSHYRHAEQHIPEGRRLIVRTSEIDRQKEDIAAFAGVRADRLQLASAKQQKKKKDILAVMDEDFVRERIAGHCMSLIQKYFPDRVRYYRTD